MKNKNDFSKLEIIQRIDALKSEIDKLRPIKREDENRIMQKFRLDWNYNSNAIEGNSLTYGETRAFLMHGITAKGKPFKDYLDIRGHNEAIDYLVDFINNKEELTEAVIRELHKIILVEPYEVDALTPDGKPTRRRIEIGVYKKQPNHIKTQTGEIHYFASPEETPAKMEELINWYRKEKDNKDMHPLILASFFHHRFAAIHPFDDGNGRMARLLMNLILMQNHFTPAVIRQNDRENYYSVLSQADAGEYLPFIEYIGEYLSHSMEIFVKGAKGEDIEELDDLDKEIELLKREIETKENKFDSFKNLENMADAFSNSYAAILKNVIKLCDKFTEFFFHKSYSFYVINESNNLEYVFEKKSKFDIPLYEFIENYKMTNKFSNGTIMKIHFQEFHSKINSFNMTLVIGLIFERTEFAIYFYIDEERNMKENVTLDEFFLLDPTFIDKYTVKMNNQETKSFCDKVGKNVLTYIKEHNQEIKN